MTASTPLATRSAPSRQRITPTVISASGYEMRGEVIQPTSMNFWQAHGVDLWYQVTLADEHGISNGTVHHSAIRI